MLFDFSDSEWHFGLDGAIAMADAYPRTALLLYLSLVTDRWLTPARPHHPESRSGTHPIRPAGTLSVVPLPRGSHLLDQVGGPLIGFSPGGTRFGRAGRPRCCTQNNLTGTAWENRLGASTP